MRHASERDKRRHFGGDPIEQIIIWIHNYQSNGKYDSTEHPNTVMYLGWPQLFTSDPDVVQDMMTTKNSVFDKSGLFDVMFQKFFGNSIFFSQADQLWRNKRKGLAHVFYKDRLQILLDNLKDYVLKKQAVWLE